MPRPSTQPHAEKAKKPINFGTSTIEMGYGKNKRMVFAPSLSSPHDPMDITFVSSHRMDSLANELSDEHNAGLSSFLEIESHSGLSHFGDAYMAAMEKFRDAAAEKLVNERQNSLGPMFKEHLAFEVNDWEAKKAYKAFIDMDADKDGKITSTE